MNLMQTIEKYLNSPGVLADPNDNQFDDQEYIVLGRERFLALISQRERFFDSVRMFQPLRRSTLRALKTLEDNGMIGTKDKPARKQRCSACARKALSSVFVQVLKHVQTLIMLFRENGSLGALGNELRAHFGANEHRRIVVYVRTTGGGIERVEF